MRCWVSCARWMDRTQDNPQMHSEHEISHGNQEDDGLCWLVAGLCFAAMIF